jgi:hypothetical protein
MTKLGRPGVKTLRISSLLVLLSVLMLSCTPLLRTGIQYGTATTGTDDVSFVSIIASPHLFEGKRIRTAGVLNLSGDGQALCLDSDSAENNIEHNCAYLILDDPSFARLGASYQEVSASSGRYVLVEAAVRPLEGAGVLNSSTLSLAEITFIYVHRDVRNH